VKFIKTLFFEKTKLLCPQKNNLIIVTNNAKQCGAQIFIYKVLELYFPFFFLLVNKL